MFVQCIILNAEIKRNAIFLKISSLYVTFIIYYFLSYVLFPFFKRNTNGVNPLKKAFMRDLKLIYRAANKYVDERALDDLEDKWVKKYSIVTTSWRNNRG